MGSLIGIILLMGLVTKNAILLIDHAPSCEDARAWRGAARSHPRSRSRERLRPILMTSGGHDPGHAADRALATVEGSEFRAPMAIAVIGGVISSTLLTLVVVPVFFLFFDGAKNFVLRWVFGRATGGPPNEKNRNAELMAELIVVSPLYLAMTVALASLSSAS